MSRAGGLKFWLLVALLVATALFLQARSQVEIVPPSAKLTSFPNSLGSWESYDQKIDDQTRQVLGPGDFLLRVYTQPEATYMQLFIAYFPSQQTGETAHSPKNCLPGGGWMFVDSKIMDLQIPAYGVVQANRAVIAKGTERQLMVYWYQAHGRTVASEYWAKFYLAADAIRLNRTDGALVRIITPLEEGESAASAQARAEKFVQLIAPGLSRYIPD